jgi:hypothetical protein
MELAGAALRAEPPVGQSAQVCDLRDGSGIVSDVVCLPAGAVCAHYGGVCGSCDIRVPGGPCIVSIDVCHHGDQYLGVLDDGGKSDMLGGAPSSGAPSSGASRRRGAAYSALRALVVLLQQEAVAVQLPAVVLAGRGSKAAVSCVLLSVDTPMDAFPLRHDSNASLKSDR